MDFEQKIKKEHSGQDEYDLLETVVFLVMKHYVHVIDEVEIKKWKRKRWFKTEAIKVQDKNEYFIPCKYEY